VVAAMGCPSFCSLLYHERTQKQSKRDRRMAYGPLTAFALWQIAYGLWLARLPLRLGLRPWTGQYARSMA